ncbi:MAG: mannose-1-phosphate guanylyltransferase [Bacteroidia bacterium]|nr:mannose-1-phosphate guanylyltransferase [Bacteroidia bacterium]
MSDKYYAVIMAGGIGSRFWPLSRNAYPKQFHDITGSGKTLIQQTFERLKAIIPPTNIYVVTNKKYLQLTAEQLPELGPHQIIGEPKMRNTAACIAYGTHKIYKKNSEALIVVTPADHLIKNTEKFQQDIQLALNICEQEPVIMTLGITPSRPDTGYGYIQFKEIKKKLPYQKVVTFTEKPNLELAQSFLHSKEFVWNSGIFIFGAFTMLEAIRKYLPDTYELFHNIKKYLDTDLEETKIEDIYNQLKSISIDFGVMEKANNVYVICTEFGWSDLGTWTSLYEELAKDANGNATIGNAIYYDSYSNLVNSVSEKLVVLKNVDNLIIVDTGDVLLICPKDKEQSIREIVSDLTHTRKSPLV